MGKAASRLGYAFSLFSAELLNDPTQKNESEQKSQNGLLKEISTGLRRIVCLHSKI
jgi:hypothetical protein